MTFDEKTAKSIDLTNEYGNEDKQTELDNSTDLTRLVEWYKIPTKQGDDFYGLVSIRDVLRKFPNSKSVIANEIERGGIWSFDAFGRIEKLHMQEEIEYALAVLNYTPHKIKKMPLFGFLGREGDHIMRAERIGWPVSSIPDFQKIIGVGPVFSQRDSPSSQPVATVGDMVEDTQKAEEKPLSTTTDHASLLSPLMKITAEVHRQFWSTFDKDAPGAKPTTQAVIVEWIRENYSLSDVAAKAVEKVACPFDRDPSKK